MKIYNEEQELFFKVKEMFIKVVETRFNVKVKAFLMNDEHTRYCVEISFPNEWSKNYTFPCEIINKDRINDSVTAIIDIIGNDIKRSSKAKFIKFLDEIDVKHLISDFQSLANAKYVSNRSYQYAQNVFLHREENKVVLEFYL